MTRSNSGNLCRNPAQNSRIQASWPEAGRPDQIPASWPRSCRFGRIWPVSQPDGRTGLRFDQNGQICPGSWTDGWGPDQIAGDLASPANLAGIRHGTAGIRRRLLDVAGFLHRPVSGSGLSESGDSQLLEHKCRLHCLKESRLRLPSTKNNLCY